MHTTTRPGLPWGGFSFSHVPMPSSSFPPLVWPPTVSRRHFCARVQRGRGEAKTQNLRKGHLQAHIAVLMSGGVYIPMPQNSVQRTAQRHTRHKATPAHSIRRKPGYCHLLRASDRTAQRSLSASHQAQREPGHKYISFKVIPPLARHPLISRGQNL